MGMGFGGMLLHTIYKLVGQYIYIYPSYKRYITTMPLKPMSEDALEGGEKGFPENLFRHA